ncbi:hypothetical protein Y1Q_0009222 [Alligator mississippiensis]|uniref:DDE Tnp4 domain-containing protein n=1 Tax=Alligator mississippiensis TaxID=8496 RepID=A0A151M2R4_ALLMI|nr:hypothetical protein Y1Q_0009222 [Alligator mississippiensis]
MIMKLATPSSLCYITNQFGIRKSMARDAVWEVCLVIQIVLTNCFICVVSPQEVVTSFYHTGFLNCMGAMDSTHIPILPSQRHLGIHQLQGLLLHNPPEHHGPPGPFTHIFTSWVGSTHNVHIF